MRFVFLSIESGQAAALQRAVEQLRATHDLDLSVGFYSASALRSAADWQRLGDDIARAEVVFGSMLFGEEIVRPLEQALDRAPGAVCMIMSNPVLIRRTRLGGFVLQARDEEHENEPGLLRRLMRSFRPKHGHGEAQRQLALVRGLSKMLKYLPGKARDLHTYITVHQYWMNCSPENLRRMLCLLVERYVPGYKGRLPVEDPLTYPDTALFHPAAPTPFPDLAAFRKWRRAHAKAAGRSQKAPGSAGTVGLLSLRAIVLGGNTAHLAALIAALEARGLEVLPVYSAGLDGRAALQKFFAPAAAQSAAPATGSVSIDLLLNATGFALVGGPAATQPELARASLADLDVVDIDLVPLAFQHSDEWQHDDRGLNPVQLAMNVALPELDGQVEPLVYGGAPRGSDTYVPLPAEIEFAAERVVRRVALHRKPNAERRVAVVLFSFPPNLGNAGTAAYLDVFASLYRLLQEMQAQGYTVELPADAEALRRAVVAGNALIHGTDGNVADQFDLADYRRLFPGYADIEPFWGAAPGELLNDGKRFHILGHQFANVFVGIQPSFGYERDPFRLLMAKDAAPHHGFAAFYAWLNHVWHADAVLHFGTHGALEFMPGKQAGLSAACWPLRLLGSLPNVYYYCVNNPSEGTIARRRGLATLVSYLVPPVQQAGLYKGLRQLKDGLDRYRRQPDPGLLDDIKLQAEQLGVAVAAETADDYVAALAYELLQIEERLIPVGLHVLGEPPAPAERVDILTLAATFARPDAKTASLPALVAAGLGYDYATLAANLRSDQQAQQQWAQVDAIVREALRRFVHSAEAGQFNYQAVDAYLAAAANVRPATLTPLWQYLAHLLARMLEEREIGGLLDALRGGYTPPSPGNDVVRNPAVVPTGRNIHGLDPYFVPTPAAQTTAAQLVAELLERQRREQGAWPESVALVLWGTDNIKTDGEGVAQALALLGARAVSDELGRIASIELLPLAELGRPRIDIVVTVSGIFRDLFGHQTGLIDRAVRLAARADEPPEQNFVRKHALAQAAELDMSIEAAATRVYSNAPGSYGANVNHLVESSTWDAEAQLGETFMNRKSFAYGVQGEWHESRELLERSLATVDLTFQNVDSVEIGVSDIDHYYEYLGGVTKSVELIRGARPAVMMGEVAQFAGPGSGRVRSLEQMVRLESRAKLLNPKWFEGMLKHGYEGVHEIEVRVSNTYGWSATANAVEGWVYQGVADTYLLDPAMRERMAQLNPHAVAGITGRLLEAGDRGFWQADEATLAALREIYADLEDRLEGVADRA